MNITPRPVAIWGWDLVNVTTNFCVRWTGICWKIWSHVVFTMRQWEQGYGICAPKWKDLTACCWCHVLKFCRRQLSSLVAHRHTRWIAFESVWYLQGQKNTTTVVSSNNWGIQLEWCTSLFWLFLPALAMPYATACLLMFVVILPYSNWNDCCDRWWVRCNMVVWCNDVFPAMIRDVKFDPPS